MRYFAASFAVVLAISAIAATAQVTNTPYTPAASDHQPPRFLPGVALYRDKRFLALQVGKTFSLSCKEALDDTQSAIAKAIENGGPNILAIGLCIPVPTYSPADLLPGAGEQEPPATKDSTI